jgi:hypothetical protein
MIQYTEKSAIFSECGKYRYVLTRVWDDAKPFVMVIGLNPSKAGSEKDDPTMRILVKSLDHLGFGGVKMVNLYSCITSNPKQIFNFLNPEVPHYSYLFTTAATCQKVIFAWGAFPQAKHRVKKLVDKFPDAFCFGKTKDGSPWHPMFLMWSGVKKEELNLIKYKNEK